MPRRHWLAQSAQWSLAALVAAHSEWLTAAEPVTQTSATSVSTAPPARETKSATKYPNRDALGRDVRPVMFAYGMSNGACPACEKVKRIQHELPIHIMWRPAPSWVSLYPTFHWQAPSKKWMLVEGFEGVDPLMAEFAKHSPPDKVLPTSPFYEYTLELYTGTWYYVGDIYQHLRFDLSNHGFSEDEVRGLSVVQMERLHSAHHNGLVRPGGHAPGVAQRSTTISRS